MNGEELNPGPLVAAHHRSGTGTARIPYPVDVRWLSVLERGQVSPGMVRLTLGGPELAGFHTYQADDHVKLIFADEDGTRRDPVQRTPMELEWPREMPRTRDYTVRRYSADAGEIDLDFVLHEGGLAAGWASAAEPGERVVVAGPRGAKAFPHTYDHYVFAVDLTALPAAARWLDESPPDVSAHLVLETDHADEHDYPLARRDGVEIVRLVRDGTKSTLASAVESLALPTGRTFLFAAGEAGEIKPLRAWSKGRLDSKITGYWKRGVAGFDD
ncbi:siderophore-interacting protein [Amycolatopsis nigrescens]|uniref:siderophore-interacting protein n=1 Tax=Amycolatopsis nigrescens TaxID=381445 RepID=UPI00037D9D68|nr:siderophore-interacting protein [Amycolatopsis nigrescens]